MDKIELKNILKFLGYTHEEIKDKYIREYLVSTCLGVIFIVIFDLVVEFVFNIDTSSSTYLTGIFCGVFIYGVVEVRSKIFENKILKEVKSNGLNTMKMIYSTDKNNCSCDENNSLLIKKSFKIKDVYNSNEKLENIGLNKR